MSACDKSTIVLSEIPRSLDNTSKARYVEKITSIGVDPYSLTLDKLCAVVSAEKYPAVSYPDIYNYLIHNPSPYTGSEMKAFKSLDAYNYFTSGLVQQLMVAQIADRFVLTARVGHSQKTTEPPLKVWVIAQSDGVIVTAHCNCMAGLTETCSHVAAVLFAVDAAVRMKESTSCTEKPCHWLDTTSSKRNIQYASLSEGPQYYLNKGKLWGWDGHGRELNFTKYTLISNQVGLNAMWP